MALDAADEAMLVHPNEEGSHGTYRSRSGIAELAAFLGSLRRIGFTADGHSTVAWNEDAGYSIFNARLKIATMSGQFVGLGP
jgi:hypothetical protein